MNYGIPRMTAMPLRVTCIAKIHLASSVTLFLTLKYSFFDSTVYYTVRDRSPFKHSSSHD